jgi:Domain of Unknown Function (DUF748)
MQHDRVMRARRRRLALLLGLVLVGSAVTVYELPQIVRRVAVARIHAVTGRPVSIEAVELNLLTGRLAVQGFRLGERDQPAPFADFGRLEARLHLPSLLLGRLWIRDLVVTDSTVRVVRLPAGDFNFSDLFQSSGTSTGPLDVTVDHFTLSGGTVTLEDRALAEPRTWTSEQITIEARNVSTRRDDGSAVGRSLTVGAPVSLEIKNLRLYPIHLQATVTMEGADLTPLQVYVPPGAPILIARGRASTTLTVTLDSREGLRADAMGRFEDVALLKPEGGEPFAVVPKLTAEITGFGFRDGDLQLAQLAVNGAMSVRDASRKQGGRYPLSTVRVNVSDLTWPARTTGRLDLLTSIPGGGTLAVAGTLQPPPAASQLRLRLSNLDLTPWAQFVPVAARITGIAEADLSVNEPLAAGVPARVQGSVAVNRLSVADARQELLGARRVEARGLELNAPTRLVVNRVLLSGPRGTIERDRAGNFPLSALAGRPPASPGATAPRGVEPAHDSATLPFGVEIGEVAVQDGRMTWRDETVSPVVLLAVSSIDASVTGVGWPVRGPLGVRVAVRPPGGGHVQVAGRVGLEPPTADLRVVTKNAELAPYQPYVPIAARLGGAADMDVAVVVAPPAERRATVRGSATLSRVDVRDGERTVARIERATATGLELDWPQRVAIRQLALLRPWLLVERDNQGGLPLRTLLTPAAGAGAVAAAPAVNVTTPDEPFAVSIAQLTADEGGIRVVDRAVSPAFAVDLQPAALRVAGFSTLPAAPARVDLAGRVGASAEFALRGTFRAFGGPLRLDLSGELREFAVPRTNPYLLHQVGWQTREGRLTTKLQCRIDGDALSARTDVRLSRLQLVRAASHDEAQTRIGLPLGLITTLLKDRRGDINVSFPVGGRLSDPRFDFRETIWSAVRTVAINAITLPVSWIGRVQFTPDSRIERIQVDPVTFEPGTATLTPQGEGRVGRLVAFLDQLPDVTLALTPIVSSRDAQEMKRRTLETAVDRAARQDRISREDATARLFVQQFPGQPVPDSPAATLAALLERLPLPTAELPELGAQRLETVRATAKRAGIDSGRLAEAKLVQREDPPGSQVEIEIREPEAPQGSKFRETLRRLGVPLKGANE